MIEPKTIETIKNLVKVSKELNEARTKLRHTMESIAGTSLSEWSFEDVIDYHNLFIKSYSNTTI